MTTIAILTLLALAAIGSWVITRRRQRITREREADIPLFAVPSMGPTPVARPAIRPRLFSDPPRVAGHDPGEDDEGRQADRRYAPHTARAPHGPAGPTIRTRDGAVSTLTKPHRTNTPAPLPADEVGEAIEGASVRYWRVADGTLQFLPGRLEIAAGRDVGQEIRFVRTAGPDGTTLTFGRAEGVPYRHVQLREPTVSRTHARMTLQSGPSASGFPRWQLENLSATNPVVVNGHTLGVDGSARSSVILSDGDRIEMGEVAFIFRAR